MSNELATQTVQAPAVMLNDEIIAKYICPKATPQERYMFLQLCKGQNLNPFLREAYLIKYGTEAATMVVGKDSFLKRARNISGYQGFKAGVVVITVKGEVAYREGGIVFQGETLVGGWAEVYRSGDQTPTRNEVSFDEYAGKKPIYDNGKKVGEELNPQWSKKPATMIRKVAVVQSHREAFPDEFEGMYSPEEMAIDTTALPIYTTDAPAEGYKPPVKQPQEKKPAPAPESGILTALITVAEVRKVTGKNKTTGKPWTKYVVVDNEGGEYGTFSESSAQFAKEAAGSGVELEIAYKKTTYGNDLETIGLPVEDEVVEEGAEG